MTPHFEFSRIGSINSAITARIFPDLFVSDFPLGLITFINMIKDSEEVVISPCRRLSAFEFSVNHINTSTGLVSFCLHPVIIASRNVIMLLRVQRKTIKKCLCVNERHRDRETPQPRAPNSPKREIKQAERGGRAGERLWIIITLEEGVRRRSQPSWDPFL